jgi:hypothetical protein
MLDKSIWVNWVTTLKALLEEYSEVDSAKLGFITEWKKQLRAL